MLTKLSRIFGITGGALAMLPYVLVIGDSVIDLIFNPGFLYLIPPEFFILRNTVPALLCSASIIAGIYVHKKPTLAGAVMIVSYVLNSFSPYSGLISVELTNVVRVLSALLLVAAGVLAIISRFTGNKAFFGSEPHSRKLMQETAATPKSLMAFWRPRERNPLSNMSRIIALFCAALNMFFWAIISIYALCSMPITDLLHLINSIPLIISAIGLLGSLLLRKKPVIGAMLIFVSGALMFLFSLASWWFAVANWLLGIIPLPLITAGLFALISRFTAGKTPASNEPRNENPNMAG